jgi:hypothetical protein
MWAIGNLREGERATYRLIHFRKALYTALFTHLSGGQSK